MPDEMIIRTLLEHDDEFALKCLVILYDKQEDDEQLTKEALRRNDVGFTKQDAPLLTELGQHYKEYKRFPLFGYRRPMEKLHKLLPKYAKQLSRYLTEEDMP